MGYTVHAGKARSVNVEVPVDAFIGHPELAVGALHRQSLQGLFQHVAASMPATDAFAGIDNLTKMGPQNPVLRAVAVRLSGQSDELVAFTLRKHLDSDEGLASLFTPIAEEEAGISYRFADRGPDDLTFELLARLLSPKGKDAALGELFESMHRGQPMGNALKKITRKKLDKLNAALEELYEEELERVFPEPQREPYRTVSAAAAAADWSRAVEAADAFLEQYPDSLAAPNAHFWRGMALAELGDGGAPDVLEDVVRRFRSSLPGVGDAQLRLARLAAEGGDVERARSAYEKARDDFGWVPGVLAAAQTGLEALDNSE